VGIALAARLLDLCGRASKLLGELSIGLDMVVLQFFFALGSAQLFSDTHADQSLGN
jgi:hypothetical protein